MTPREIMAALEVAQARQRRETAERLSIAALGAQGKPAAITAELNRLSKD